MKRPTPIQIITSLSVLALFVGLGMTVNTFSTGTELKQRLSAKRTFLVRMTALGQEWQRAQLIKQTYEALSPGEAVPLQSLINECFSNRSVTPSALTSIASLPGWIEWQTSLSIDGLSIPELAPFMQRLAAQSPPWTVTRLDASAIGQSNGLVRVTLALAALRNSGWPAPHAEQPGGSP